MFTRACQLATFTAAGSVKVAQSINPGTAAAAARELAAMDYTNVRDYADGKQDWIDAGLPIESEHHHQSKQTG